jgi:hypothetical protein
MSLVSRMDKNLRMTFCAGGNISGIIGEKGNLDTFYTGVNFKVSFL